MGKKRFVSPKRWCLLNLVDNSRRLSNCVPRGEKIFSSRGNKKCCLVTCYPPVFSIHHFSFLTERSIHSPPFQIRIDHTRFAHPLKAFKGIADSVWSLPPSLFLFFSLSKDYIGRYILIYIRAHDILKVRQQVTKQHFRSTAVRESVFP